MLRLTNLSRRRTNAPRKVQNFLDFSNIKTNHGRFVLHSVEVVLVKTSKLYLSDKKYFPRASWPKAALLIFYSLVVADIIDSTILPTIS